MKEEDLEFNKEKIIHILFNCGLITGQLSDNILSPCIPNLETYHKHLSILNKTLNSSNI